MAERLYDILVAGEINPDLILSGDPEPVFGQVEKWVENAALTIGSSAVIFACGAARLGLKVALVGLCGEDVFGRFMLEEMALRQVDTSEVIRRPEEKTGLSVILNRGTDRAILTYPGLIPALQAGDIPDRLLQKTRHLHVGSYFLQTALQPGLVDLFKRAHRNQVTTSLDTNWDPDERWSGLDELLPLTDVFLPNQAEALSLTRQSNLEAAVSRLADVVGLLAVKLGPQGGLARRGNSTVYCRGIPVQIVDTVGAGDSFDAGFLFGYLNGWEMGKCLQLGTVCGALSTQTSGGTNAQPTLSQAMAVLNRIEVYSDANNSR